MSRNSMTLVIQASPVAAHPSRELDSLRRPHFPPSMPPEYVPRRHTQPSPLGPPNANGGGQEKTCFEAMLQASRERSAMLSVKKPLELRKELAVVRAQKVKQLERRARFLNKLCQPPSPSAADSPVTPPDSPTIFHFTLPSPGLQSPSEVFEDVHDHPERYRNTKRVEQVDFGLRYKKRFNIRPHRRHSSLPIKNHVNLLPSLDQISQRLNKAPVSCNPPDSPFPEHGQTGTNRLPSFLRSRHFSPPSEVTPSCNDQPPRGSRPALPRLALCPATPPGPLVVQSSMSQHTAFLELTPCPLDKELVVSQITVSLSPPPPSKSLPASYAEFSSEHSGVVSEGSATIVIDDIATPDLRAQLTRDMFNKLSRRTPSLPNAVACGIKARDDTSQASSLAYGVENKPMRRRSAPAGVPTPQRGAHHPVLEKPGGF